MNSFRIVAFRSAKSGIFRGAKGDNYFRAVPNARAFTAHGQAKINLTPGRTQPRLGQAPCASGHSQRLDCGRFSAIFPRYAWQQKHHQPTMYRAIRYRGIPGGIDRHSPPNSTAE